MLHILISLLCVFLFYRRNSESLYSVPSKFNVFGSNMFDVSTPYEAFATDLVPIKFTILREHDKILNLSIPYLSTIVFTLVSVKTFKI